MPFAVKVHPDVARAKPGDEGTRRRSWKTRGGRDFRIFNRHPTMLDVLPPEVKADPMLIAVKVEAEKPAPKAKRKPKASEE